MLKDQHEANETKDISMRSGQFHLKEHRSSKPPPPPDHHILFSMSDRESDEEESIYESPANSSSEMDEDNGSLTPRVTPTPNLPLVNTPSTMDIDQVDGSTAVTAVAVRPSPQLEDREIQGMETDNPLAISLRPVSPLAAPATQTPRQLEYHTFIPPNTSSGGDDDVGESRDGKRRRRNSESRATPMDKGKTTEPLFLPEPESTLHKDQQGDKRASIQKHYRPLPRTRVPNTQTRKQLEQVKSVASVQKTQLLLQEQRLRLTSRDLQSVQQEAGERLGFFEREFAASQNIIAGLRNEALKKETEWEARFEELRTQYEGDMASDEWKRRIRAVVVSCPLLSIFTADVYCRRKRSKRK